MSPLYLAVDAGGTRTTFVLATATQVLARTSAGSIKRLRVAADVAEQHLDDALTDLHAQTGLDLSQVERTCVGIAGQTVPMVREWVETAFRERVGGELVIGGDVDIALDAAFQNRRGALVLAGTGSNVLARAEDGEVFNVGGWGPMLGDQGSGYWIGRQCMFTAFQSMNAGRPSPFLTQVMEAWGTDSVEEVVALAHGPQTPDFAALSRIAASLSAEGDPDCREVLLQAGDELAAQVRGALRRMYDHEMASREVDFDMPKWTPPPVACAGSVLEHISLVRESMTVRLQQSFPYLEILPGVVDPVMGALWCARTP